MSDVQEDPGLEGRVFLTGIGAFVCATILWELVARRAVQSQPARIPFEPGGQISTGRVVQSDEGYSRTSFDSRGFRAPVPNGKPRKTVLVLGDSYTEALQVSDREAFPEQTQTRLIAKGMDIGFYNAGVSGGAPPRYIAVGPYFQRTLQPDEVVVQLNESDFSTDYFDRAHNFFPEKTGDEYKVVVLPSAGKQRMTKLPGFSTLLRSSLFQMASKKVVTGKAAASGNGRSSKVSAKLAGAELRRYIQWSVKNLRSAYANLTLIYVPYINYYNLDDLGNPCEAILGEECGRAGVNLIDMRDIYVRHFLATGVCPNGFSNTSPGKGHINAVGHALLAEALSERLEARLLH